ncbi:conjugal transfer protein [Flavonifractor sp. An82]|uniref:cysteine-rich KTR domain-containing protein n=1 Tax=Oscillospiraceae TaxID=216572 RepID=UPI000B3660EA|nr:MULTISPECIES: cysteine-rich KTR domain-containing protein [Oscillospiraceae]MBM6925478.1 conjugal transfer protein [Pseudoflavonifractor phocaeensis]OUN20361.1 conjugal transfer protein [Flavonifractor sp. An82]
MNQSYWLRCPVCGERSKTKVYADTVLVRFPLYCPRCKKECRVDVVQLKMILSKEPDA